MHDHDKAMQYSITHNIDAKFVKLESVWNCDPPVAGAFSNGKPDLLLRIRMKAAALLRRAADSLDQTTVPVGDIIGHRTNLPRAL